MNINSVSPISCKRNFSAKLKNAKELTVPLKNGTEASFTVADNYLECLITRGDKIVEGKGKYSTQGITSKDIWGTFEKVQDNVKSGVDFFKEFSRAILSW